MYVPTVCITYKKIQRNLNFLTYVESHGNTNLLSELKECLLESTKRLIHFNKNSITLSRFQIWMSSLEKQRSIKLHFHVNMCLPTT